MGNLTLPLFTSLFVLLAYYFLITTADSSNSNNNRGGGGGGIGGIPLRQQQMLPSSFSDTSNRKFQLYQQSNVLPKDTYKRFLRSSLETTGGGGQQQQRVLQISRSKIPIELDLLLDDDDSFDKSKRYDDYGHMRFGKRGGGEDQFDDYGHLRFGKRGGIGGGSINGGGVGAGGGGLNGIGGMNGDI